MRRFGSSISCALLVGIAACSGDIPPSGAKRSDAGTKDVTAQSDAHRDVDATPDVSEEIACGGLGQICCGTRCAAFLNCAINPNDNSAQCLPCGSVSQPCCTSDVICLPGLTCETKPSGAVCTERKDTGTCMQNCVPPGGQYCGEISDGCGGTVECGPCQRTGFTCGGRGIPGLCGADPDSGACEPIVCSTPAGQYCGQVGDGCGGTIDCGACPEGTTCGGGGLPNRCGPGSGCQRLVCSKGGTNYCGLLGDGCGSSLNCPLCPGGQPCGEVIPNVCGTPCATCSICDGGRTTTVSGVAVTGAATNPDPVPGAIVYVPQFGGDAGPLPPLPAGVTCRSCDPAPLDAVAWTVAGPDGKFTLGNVPAGNAIPIVVQRGAWRRMTTISVAPCADNVLPAGSVRLPRHHNEGDIPMTAIITGSDDPIECVLRKMGVEDSEFSNPDGGGRIHVYRGTGATLDARTPDASTFVAGDASPGTWRLYHQLLLPCQGSEILASPAALANFTSYANGGGRVLATHFSYTWLAGHAPWSSIGTWTPGAADAGAPLTIDVTTTTEPNNDFVAWLGAVNALTRPSPPQMSIRGAYSDLRETVNGAELWLTSFSPPTTQLVSMPAPWLAPGGQNCGRITFADFHAATTSSQGTTFPSECDADLTLSPEEKAIEYMLFDLGSCASTANPPPSVPPLPPRPPPPPLPPPPPGSVGPRGRSPRTLSP
ncbi:MAG: hypothetical protein ABW133_25005 [Polyangiaceae bacterium]